MKVKIKSSNFVFEKKNSRSISDTKNIKYYVLFP